MKKLKNFIIKHKIYFVLVFGALILNLSLSIFAESIRLFYDNASIDVAVAVFLMIISIKLFFIAFDLPIEYMEKNK